MTFPRGLSVGIDHTSPTAGSLFATTRFNLHPHSTWTRLTICYVLVKNGLDVEPIFQFFGVAEWIPNGAAGPMIVAFAFNKVCIS